MQSSEISDPALFRSIAQNAHSHSPTSTYYEQTAELIRNDVIGLRASMETQQPFTLGEVGAISLPFVDFGSVDSLDLLGLDELILFAFYWANVKRYGKVTDIGANIGLHSVVLGKLGYQVDSYEPDPVTFETLKANISLNSLTNVSAHQAAVSDKGGSAEFVRVLGNTTSSHLSGSKSTAYGDLETIEVETVGVEAAVVEANLLKIDAEGHEASIISAIPLDRWGKLDAVVEVGSAENASLIWDRFEDVPSVSLRSQLRNWELAKSLDDLPTSYRGGSVFITSGSSMYWG